MSLSQLLAERESDCTVGLLGDRPLVTIGVIERGEIEVVYDGTVQVMRPETRVEPVSGWERQLSLIQAAVPVVATSRRTEADEFAREFERVRDYAIARHLDGFYNREALNAFLREFGLAEYDPDADTSKD